MLSADDVTPRPEVVPVTSSNRESRDHDENRGSLGDERKGSWSSLRRCWGSVTSLQGADERRVRRESIVESLEKKRRDNVRCRLRSKLLTTSVNNTSKSSLPAAADLPVIVRPPAANSALPHRSTSRASMTGRHLDWMIEQPVAQSTGLQVYFQPQYHCSSEITATQSSDDDSGTAFCDANQYSTDGGVDDASVRQSNSSSSVCQPVDAVHGNGDVSAVTPALASSSCAGSLSALSNTRPTSEGNGQTQRSEDTDRTDVDRYSSDADTDSSSRSDESAVCLRVNRLLSRSDASPSQSQCRDNVCTSWSTGAHHPVSAEPVWDGQAECSCRPVAVRYINAAADTTQTTDADELQTNKDLKRSKYAALTHGILSTDEAPITENMGSDGISQNEALRLDDNEARTTSGWSDDDVIQLVTSSGCSNSVGKLSGSGEPSQTAISTAGDCTAMTSSIGGHRYRTSISLSLATTTTTAQPVNKLVCYSATLRESSCTGHRPKQVAPVSNSNDPAPKASPIHALSSLARTTQRDVTELYSPDDNQQPINERQSVTASRLLRLADSGTTTTSHHIDDDDVTVGDQRCFTDTATSSDDDDDVNHVFHHVSVEVPQPPPLDHTQSAGPSVERSWQTLRTDSRPTAVVQHRTTSAQCASTTRPQDETPAQRANSLSAPESTYQLHVRSE